MLPSRGVHWGSGLEPAPHLVGERARALDVLAAEGSSQHPRPRSPSRCRRRMRGPSRSGSRPAKSQPRAALRVARARGVRARRSCRRARSVRGARRAGRRVSDDGARAGARRVLGRRDRADARVLAVHPTRAASGRGGRIYPAAERRLDLVEPTLVDDGEPVASPDRPRAARARRSRPRLAGRRGPHRLGRRRTGAGPVRQGAALLDTLPAGQPFAFEAQRPALVARGLAEAENELGAFVRGGQRVVVAFPHLGEALRQQNLLRRVEARILDDGEGLPREAGLLFAVTPARRGFVWRELGLVLLPDTQVFRKRPPRERAAAAGRCSRSRISAAATTSSTRTTASGSCSGSRRRRWPASRATTSSSASGATTVSTSRTSSSARCRATSARTARRPRSRSSAARRGTTSRTARANGCASSPASSLRSTRTAAGAGRGVRPSPRVPRAARGGVPVPRDAGPAGRDRSGEGRSRGAAADGPPRVRRRRLRQDRGGDPRRVRRGGQRQADADARADDDSRASSTGTPSATATATSLCVSRWSPASGRRGRSSRCLPTSRTARSTS